MQVIGITGCIGSGKSFVSLLMGRMLNAFVINADTFAKDLLDPKDLIQLFPSCIQNNKLDTKKLGQIVFSDPDQLDILEGYIFPRFKTAMSAKVKELTILKKHDYLILEAPTLFESKSETICDFIITVIAPRKLCIDRALARNHFTDKQIEFILKRQRPNEYKIARSDYLVYSNFGENFVIRQLSKIIGDMNERHQNMS